MNTNTAFAREYKGSVNFMTPNIIKRGKRGALHYELSSGRGIMDDTIYGVTVLEVHGQDIQRRHDLSTCFESEAAAKAYIANDFSV